MSTRRSTRSPGAPKLEDVEISRLIGDAVVLEFDRGGDGYGYTG